MDVHPRADSATSILGIDHLTLRVSEGEAMARFFCEHLGLERVAGDETTVASAGGGTRIVLREGGEASEPGVLARIVLRVSDLEGALSRLPGDVKVEREAPELAVFTGPERLGLGLTSVLGGGVDYDLDHLVLRALDPEETTMVLAELGFVPRGGALHVTDKQVRVEPNPGAAGDGPSLGHIGLLVDSLDAVEAQATPAAAQVEISDSHRLCLHVRGPEHIRLEYTERFAGNS